MTGLTGPRGRFGPTNMPTADNRIRFRPHSPGPAAEGVLREMAFVLHLTRSVRNAMLGQETPQGSKPD
jgi:hypothetical protein